jgi:Flp pilus assembly protein TadG
MRKSFGLSLLIARLCRDERGSIIIQATLTIVVIMGMIGLALDGGRLFMVNNDLQDLADAAALAGAAKLDGTSGAMERADAAARTLNNNVRWWDVSGPKILPGTSGVQFYETLADLDANSPVTDDKHANYIKVTTGSWQVAPTFLVAVGAVSNNSMHATAVAESGTAVCVPASMMLCNPSEPLTGSTGDTSTFNPTPGTMFVFSTTGNTGDFSPGVFNLLQDANQDNSDPAVGKLLAQQTANLCSTAGTSPAQGQKTNATKIGINVRFDQQPNGNVTGLDQTPAPIKIDGYVPRNGTDFCDGNLVNDTPTPYSNCATDQTISCALPRDQTFTSVGGSGGSQIGGGVALTDLEAYWSNHHPGTLPTGVTTRFQIYQLEVAGTGGAGTWLTDEVEPHGPLCAPARTAVPPGISASRRVIPVAIVDCRYWGVHGNSLNNIRINSYADFFLTESTPTSGITSGNIYTEFVTMHRSDEAGGGLHSIVRLVR